MVGDLDRLTWPAASLGEALAALARAGGLAPRSVELQAPPLERIGNDRQALGRWIETASDRLGLEAEPAHAPYVAVGDLVRRAGPALLRLPGEGSPRFLALLRGGRRGVSILGPDLAVHRWPPEVVRAALCRTVEVPLAAEIDRLLDEAGVPGRRRERARAAILRERLSAVLIGGVWLLRLPSGASFRQQIRQASALRLLLVFAGAATTHYALWLLSWLVIGRAALQGQLDRGWLLAWALLLLTLIPVRLLVTWAQGRLVVAIGGRLKQRLLAGALRLAPEEVRHRGAGQFMGQVMESEAVEILVLSGGFLGFVALIELVWTVAVLSVGAGGRLHVLLLLTWVALAGLLGRRFFQDRGHWTQTRLDMTHDLIERMVGHRTRLVQEAPERWHDDEDQTLARYLALASAMDRRAALMFALVPRGWLVLGLLGLTPAFVAGDASPAALAIGLGGVLLAFRAFRNLEAGLRHIAAAAIAWRQVAPLFHAAARPQIAGSPTFALHVDRPAAAGQTLLEAHDLVFRYRERGEPVLRGVDLRIDAGDRLLLEGPSGGGKSTLAALLTGLQSPAAGLLLLRGLDQHTLGAGAWRQQVVSAPQFHENHVLTETFAFNLLMGGRWPPRPGDLEAAEMVCRELGLGDLLDRMPAGLMQMVGETGWRLSHGERSRLYIARALLQGADVVILDESFAALDPETLRRALACVLARAPTLLVIAHP